MTLPSPSDFLTEAGFTAAAKASPSKVFVKPTESAGEKEMRSLLIQYCASYLSAKALEAVRFDGLAARLGCEPEMLSEVATFLNSGDYEGKFWDDVLVVRVQRAAASRIFTDASWERLESLAVNKLIDLAERNMIRDPGELIAVATAARRSQVQPVTPSSGQTVNINLGDGAMSGQSLPGAGAKMTIDLSPRVASSLMQKEVTVSANKSRVIDGEMLSAKELRSMLMNPSEVLSGDPHQSTDEPQTNSDGDIT